MMKDQTKNGCVNCSHKKNLDTKYYKCTELRSQPNVMDSNSKATGFIKDLGKLLTGFDGKLFISGCSCQYWNSKRETVQFT